MWPNPQFPADLVIFTEELLNKNLYFLCFVSRYFTKLVKDLFPLAIFSVFLDSLWRNVLLWISLLVGEINLIVCSADKIRKNFYNNNKCYWSAVRKYNTARAHLLYVQTIGIGSRYCIFISMSVLGLNQALGRLWWYYKTCYKR